MCDKSWESLTKVIQIWPKMLNSVKAEKCDKSCESKLNVDNFWESVLKGYNILAKQRQKSWGSTLNVDSLLESVLKNDNNGKSWESYYSKTINSFF